MFKKEKFCPECGGNLVWANKLKTYTCTSCGLEISEDERKELSFRKVKKKNSLKEYVEWWLSSKKKRKNK